uniref:Putative secreted protein n=1 Tax=Amblyomma americanum TaxID=6943 RepID=A0A0C9RWV2_AMBAM
MKAALLLLLSIIGSLRKEATGSQSVDVCAQRCVCRLGLYCDYGCSCGEYYYGEGVCHIKPGFTQEQVAAAIDANAVIEAVTQISGDLLKKGINKMSKVKIKLPKIKMTRFGVSKIMKLIKIIKKLLRFRG